jgi:hypothetical protein
MIERRGTSSVAALVMARTMQRVAKDRDDPEMLADAVEYESRALAAIKLHLSELPEVEKPAAFQLQLPLTGGYWWGLLERPKAEKPAE